MRTVSSLIPAAFRHRVTLSVREVTELTPFSAADVRRLIERGQLQASKVEGRWHVAAASLWRLLGLAGEPEPEEDEIIRRFREGLT